MKKSTEIIERIKSIIPENVMKDEEVKCYSGQIEENRVYIKKETNPRTYFEFGDLRLEFEKSRIIVEVDTAGGVTNLAKYFFMLNEKEKEFDFKEIDPDKSTYLLHIFVCNTNNDYLAHRKLWSYIQSKLIADKLISKMEVWDTNEPVNKHVESTFMEMLNDAYNKNS